MTLHTDNASSSSATTTADTTFTTSNVHNFVRIYTAYEQICNEHNQRQLWQPTATVNTTKNQQTTIGRNNSNNNNNNNNTNSADASFPFTGEEEMEFLKWFYEMSHVRITPL